MMPVKPSSDSRAVCDDLGLTDDLHITLWSTDRKYRLTIAYFAENSEGYYLQFVGDRPLDKRVNWRRFRKLIEMGQKLADATYKKERKAR